MKGKNFGIEDLTTPKKLYNKKKEIVCQNSLFISPVRGSATIVFVVRKTDFFNLRLELNQSHGQTDKNEACSLRTFYLHNTEEIFFTHIRKSNVISNVLIFSLLVFLLKRYML